MTAAIVTVAAELVTSLLVRVAAPAQSGPIVDVCVVVGRAAGRTAPIKDIALRTSPSWPGVGSSAMERPRESTVAWIS